MVNIDKSGLDALNAGKNKKPAKRNKYGAKEVVIDGYTFPSGSEGERYLELKLQDHCGFISDLKWQANPDQKIKRFILQEGFRHPFFKRKQSHISYTPDFSYVKDGKLIYEDSKGVRTEAYVLRRKMLLKRYPNINFIET